MRRAKSVVDIEVGKGGQFFRKGDIVGRFLGMEAHVFQQQNVARREGRHLFFSIFADHISGELHLPAQQFAEAGGHRFHREFFLRAILGASQMRNANHRRTLFQQQLKGRQRGAYAFVIRDSTRLFILRNVEVHAANHAFSLEGDILQMVPSRFYHRKTSRVIINDICSVPE